MGGNKSGVGVWRVEDGRQVARMQATEVWCLAVSEDDRWVAAGTLLGDVVVWDTQTGLFAQGG